MAEEIKVLRNSHTVMVWNESEGKGIVFPATVSTSILDFTTEVRSIVLQKMRNIRFVSLVFSHEFVRNYKPMKAFLEEKEHIKCNDGEERELYDFLQYDDCAARELFHFFFAHTETIIYEDGWVEYEFKFEM